MKLSDIKVDDVVTLAGGYGSSERKFLLVKNNVSFLNITQGYAQVDIFKSYYSEDLSIKKYETYTNDSPIIKIERDNKVIFERKYNALLGSLYQVPIVNQNMAVIPPARGA